MNGPNMDSERLLYDDGHSGCRRRGAEPVNDFETVTIAIY